ncbi:MAG: DNA alkylation repair protein [Oscillospiraceae bacterium]|nr:DNA alkylation repair protein [Oscillospiraceae bacterium]
MTIYDLLAEKRDEKFASFQAKLVPNIPAERIIGVRTPQMRAIAKEVYRSVDRDEFLNDLPHKWYEEDLVHFFVIAMIRDMDECIRQVDRFLPYVDCWPVSDQATPAAFKKDHKKLLPHVKRWIASDHVYTARFGIRMLMNEYLGDDFDEKYLKLVASKKGDDYYLKMMIAWYFATALAKQYDSAVGYIEGRMLDEDVRRKAIQKAVESYRVTDEHKEHLKSLR